MLHDLIGATGTVGANQHLAAPLPAAVGNDNWLFTIQGVVGV